MLPIPNKLLKQGVRDMLRISDARMSGTSYGACILHVAPESFVGGPLAAVHNGDIISVDVDKRSLHLDVPEDEIARRLRQWRRRTGSFRAATTASTPSTSRRPTRAATSISWKAPRRLPEPEIH